MRALDVSVSELCPTVTTEASLIHGHAGVRGLGCWLTFEQQLTTKSVSAIGANNDIGREHLSSVKSDRLARHVDGDDFGICPVSGSSLLAQLVEELSDVCELDREQT
jgi:hypothetical protein